MNVRTRALVPGTGKKKQDTHKACNLLSKLKCSEQAPAHQLHAANGVASLVVGTALA